jgi:hypothetical protein
MRAVATGRDHDVRLLLTGLAREFAQVLGAAAFADVRLDSTTTQDFDGLGQLAPRFAPTSGRIEKDDELHGIAPQGCRIADVKSRCCRGEFEIHPVVISG